MDGSLVAGQIRWKVFSHSQVYGLSNGWTGVSLAEIRAPWKRAKLQESAEWREKIAQKRQT